MTRRSQREYGIALAKKFKAPLTAGAIKNGACYETILQQACEEVGLAVVVQALLESNDPWMIERGLRHLPNLSKLECAVLGNAIITIGNGCAAQVTLNHSTARLISGQQMALRKIAGHDQ